MPIAIVFHALVFFVVLFGLAMWGLRERNIRRYASRFSVPIHGSRKDAKIRIYLLHGMSSTYQQVLSLGNLLCWNLSRKSVTADVILLNYPSHKLSNVVHDETTQLFHLVESPHPHQTTFFCGVSLGGFLANHLARRFIRVHPEAKDRTALITIASPSGGMPLLSTWWTAKLARLMRGGITDALVPTHVKRDFASHTPLPPKRHLAIVANPWFSGPYWFFHGTDDGLVPLSSQKAGADACREIATHHAAIHSHPSTYDALYRFVTKTSNHSLDSAIESF